MLRDMESLAMSPNIGDYVSYGRLLSVYAPFATLQIQSGGAFGDPYIYMTTGQYTISFLRRTIPGGPFGTLGHSARLLVGASTTPVGVQAMDLVNNVAHCSVNFIGLSGIITISNSTGVIFTSGPGQFPPNARFWCEVKFVIGSGTSGAVYVKLPSTTISLTGVNTQNGSRAVCDTTQWYVPNGGSLSIQHMLWWDTTGTYNNNWLGDRRVFGALPTANGSTNQFTPNGLTNNWQNAASAPPNGADYNAAGTVGYVDLYTGSAPAGVTAIAGVMVSAITEQDASGTRSFATQLKSSTTLSSGASVVMTSSYTTNNSDIWETDPATGVPIVPSALPNLQFGGKVAA